MDVLVDLLQGAVCFLVIDGLFGVLQYAAGSGHTTTQTNNPICDTKYYTKVCVFLCVTSQLVVHNQADVVEACGDNICDACML